MKTIYIATNFTKAVRTLTASALIASFVCLPTASSAGVKDRVEQVRGKVTELKNNTQAKFDDIQNNVEGLDGEGLQQMKEMVTSMMQFLKETQAGYKDFTGTDNCGSKSQCGAFRGQLRKMILSFVKLPHDLPFVENIPPAIKQLDEMARLVDHMPPPILYMTEKVLGNLFDEIQYRLEVVKFAAAQTPQLPTMAELNQATAYSARTNSTATSTRSIPSTSTKNVSTSNFPHCTAVLVTGKPHIELLQASLKALHETLSDIAGMMPNQQTLGASFVGGFTVSIKNPPKGAMDAIVFIAKALERQLTLKLAVTKSVCALSGFTPPSN